MNNTNLTCYLIGEIAADLVRGRRLAPLARARGAEGR
jgi:hypothetical protein